MFQQLHVARHGMAQAGTAIAQPDLSPNDARPLLALVELRTALNATAYSSRDLIHVLLLCLRVHPSRHPPARRPGDGEEPRHAVPRLLRPVGVNLRVRQRQIAARSAAIGPPEIVEPERHLVPLSPQQEELLLQNHERVVPHLVVGHHQRPAAPGVLRGAQSAPLRKEPVDRSSVRSASRARG